MSSTQRPTKPPFEAVVEQHGLTVLRVCRSVIDSVDADDAWSETFLSALQAYPELPAEANVEAWLVRIARRKAIDVIRRRSRQPIPTETLPESARGLKEPNLIEPDDDLWTAIRELPERQRLAVAYHHLAGLPYAEVAELIGGKPAAVRRSAADGIAALRRSYPTRPIDSDEG